MKKLFVAAALSLGLVSLAQASTMPKGDAAAGEAKAAACGACHGADGNSMAPTFPRLAGQGERYIYKQLQDFKASRRANPTMMGMAMPLSDQDMADLAAFYAKQTPAGGMAKADLAKKGERIYRGGNAATGLAACAGCHNPAGKGNALAGFPRLGGQHADYVKAQLQAFRAAGRNDAVTDPALKRANDAAKLSDAEIEAVASYISGLH